MKKRIFALLTTAAMMLSLAACTQENSATDGESNAATGGGSVFSEPTAVELTVASHITWPYNENWAIWDIIEEKTGVDLQITAIPSSDIGTKLPLMMSNPEDLPDMFYLISGTKTYPDEYGPDGALIALNQNLDKLPNFTEFWNGVPDKDAQMQARTSGDGNIYMAPVYGTDDMGGKTWMYRKDIFEKHNLEIPTTMQELYEVCKKLKELYPDSYPLCLRSGIHVLDCVAQSWKENMSYHPNYDYKTGEWNFGVVEPEFGEMIAFFCMMIEEGLVPADFFTITTKTWEELMYTDRGFISFDYIVRIDQCNNNMREQNPEYTFEIMAPPKAETENGVSKVLKQFPELNGFMLVNSGDETRVDNALKLLDWFYSPEGIETQSWGKEGVTYEVVDGERKWLASENTDVMNAFGMFTPGAYTCVDPEAYNKQYSEEQVAQSVKLKEYETENPSPFFTMSFSDDVASERADIWVALNGLCAENLSKFLLGQRPMEEWDSFVQELNDLGVERLLELYNTQYNKIMNR